MARWLCLVLARLALGEVIPLDATTELRVCAANVLRITKCLGCLAEVMAGMNIIDHQAGENEGNFLGVEKCGGAWREDANLTISGIEERKSWRFSMPNLHRRPGATAARETFNLARPFKNYWGTHQGKKPHCRIFMNIPFLDRTPWSFHCFINFGALNPTV